MESKFHDQGQIDQDLDEWLYPRGSQHDRIFFSEEEKQEYKQIEDSSPEGATTSNQDPEGEISTMVVIKWSDAIKRPIIKVEGPLCGGFIKGRSWVYSSLIRNRPRCQSEFLHLVQR